MQHCSLLIEICWQDIAKTNSYCVQVFVRVDLNPIWTPPGKYSIYLIWNPRSFYLKIKWEAKQYHTVGTVSINRTIKGKMDTPNTNTWLYWLGTCSSITREGLSYLYEPTPPILNDAAMSVVSTS